MKSIQLTKYKNFDKTALTEKVVKSIGAGIKSQGVELFGRQLLDAFGVVFKQKIMEQGIKIPKELAKYDFRTLHHGLREVLFDADRQLFDRDLLQENLDQYLVDKDLGNADVQKRIAQYQYANFLSTIFAIAAEDPLEDDLCVLCNKLTIALQGYIDMRMAGEEYQIEKRPLRVEFVDQIPQPQKPSKQAEKIALKSEFTTTSAAEQEDINIRNLIKKLSSPDYKHSISVVLPEIPVSDTKKRARELFEEDSIPETISNSSTSSTSWQSHVTNSDEEEIRNYPMTRKRTKQSQELEQPIGMQLDGQKKIMISK